jgi:hypothetical protein
MSKCNTDGIKFVKRCQDQAYKPKLGEAVDCGHRIELRRAASVKEQSTVGVVLNDDSAQQGS